MDGRVAVGACGPRGAKHWSIGSHFTGHRVEGALAGTQLLCIKAGEEMAIYTTLQPAVGV